jgi:hypothetical protein
MEPGALGRQHVRPDVPLWASRSPRPPVRSEAPVDLVLDVLGERASEELRYDARDAMVSRFAPGPGEDKPESSRYFFTPWIALTRAWKESRPLPCSISSIAPRISSSHLQCGEGSVSGAGG